MVYDASLTVMTVAAICNHFRKLTFKNGYCRDIFVTGLKLQVKNQGMRFKLSSAPLNCTWRKEPQHCGEMTQAMIGF